MREISLADGTTGTQIELGSLVKVVAGDAKGERAAVVTEAGVQVVDLRSHRSRKVTIPACESPDSPAFGADGKDLWFGCGGATAVRVTRRIKNCWSRLMEMKSSPLLRWTRQQAMCIWLGQQVRSSKSQEPKPSCSRRPGARQQLPGSL